MQKLVVVSSEGGEYITSTDVEEQHRVAVVLAYLRMLPGAAFYLDGQLVPEEELAALQAAVADSPASSGDTPHRPSAPPPEPEAVQDYNETLQRAFDDVRKANVQSMRDMAEVTRLFGAVLIEQQRQFADEAVRQRELARKSLADVDLLGRSVAATEFQNVLAMAGSDNAARARKGGNGMTLGDLWLGARRIFTGEK